MKTSFRKIKDTFVMMSASSDGMDDPYAFSSTSNNSNISNGGDQLPSISPLFHESLIDSGLIAKRLNDIIQHEFNLESSTAAGKIGFSYVIDNAPDDRYGSSFSDIHFDTSSSSSYKQSDDFGLMKNKRRKEYDTQAAIRYQEDKMLFLCLNSATLMDLVTQVSIMSFYHLNITHVALSRNGHLAFTGGHGKVRVWNTNTGRIICVVDNLAGASNPVSVSPKNDHFLVGCRTIMVINQNGNGNSSSHNNTTEEDDDDNLANVNYDNNKYKMEKNHQEREVMQNQINYHDIVMIILYPATNSLGMGNGHQNYTVEEDEILLHGHTDVVNCIKHAEFGGLAVSGSNDGTARIWDVTKGFCIQTFSLFSDPRETKVYDGMTEELIYLDENGKEIISYQPPVYPIDLIDIISNGTIVMAASSKNGLAMVWNVIDGSCIASFSCSPLQIHDISLGTNGQFCAMNLSNNLIHIYSLRREHETDETGAFVLTYPGIQLCLFSSDGSQLLTVHPNFSLVYFYTPICLFNRLNNRLTATY